ncbi:MAG: LUD domain-containing protein [Cytophagaceae bacterium]
MAFVKSREVILNKIRAALSKLRNNPIPDFTTEVFIQKNSSDSSIEFAENFVKSTGEFIFCETPQEFYEKMASIINARKIAKIAFTDSAISEKLMAAGIEFQDLQCQYQQADATITFCDGLISSNGSIAMSEASEAYFPDKHIIIAYSSQIVPDIKSLLGRIRKNHNNSFPEHLSFINGGGTDPYSNLKRKELTLFLIDDIRH